jgi:hypothetical protein
LYSSKPSYVLGFHGLDRDVGKKILNGEENFLHSNNGYDWLGDGIYFWESSPERAKQWAEQSSKRKDSKVKEPFVLGAILDLKTCLDLLDQKWIDFLRKAQKDMFKGLKKAGHPLPSNQRWHQKDTDFKNRELDCAVIRYAVALADESGIRIDSVRSVFWEGKRLYGGAGFRTHNHIQLAIINEDCIKGIFLPRTPRTK